MDRPPIVTTPGGDSTMSLKRLSLRSSRRRGARVRPRRVRRRMTTSADATTHGGADHRGRRRRGRRHRQDHRQRAADRPRLARRDLQERAEGRPTQYDDVDFQLLEAADADSQAQQIEQAIAQKPDALVVLPAGRRGADARSPRRPSRRASRSSTSTGCSPPRTPRPRRSSATTTRSACWRRTTSAEQLKCKGNVVEIQGLAGISVTTDRSKGFADELKKVCPDGGIKIVA